MKQALRRPDKFNIELAETVLEHLILHPEMHNQRTVMNVCGTQGCVAGWTWMLYNKEHKSGPFDVDQPPWYEAFDVMDQAQQLLGITDKEACRLFSASIYKRTARKVLASMIAQARRYHAKVEEQRQRDIDKAARLQMKAARPAPSRLTKKSKTTI